MLPFLVALIIFLVAGAYILFQLDTVNNPWLIVLSYLLIAVPILAALLMPAILHFRFFRGFYLMVLFVANLLSWLYYGHNFLLALAAIFGFAAIASFIPERTIGKLRNRLLPKSRP
ncbi:hypothetical protein HYY74_02915 [Candidatus Woesearchaeota archaeon]|nr:hypothetical protein [Candidatus Woesearchaeota archaeon]